jgi:hypothetical protein
MKTDLWAFALGFFGFDVCVVESCDFKPDCFLCFGCFLDLELGLTATSL